MNLSQQSRADILNGQKLTEERIMYFLGTAE